MPHTHTLEIEINGTDFEGEVTFSGTNPFHLEPSAMDTDTEKFKCLSEFINGIAEFSKVCGEIQKIEILKKEVL